MRLLPVVVLALPLVASAGKKPKAPRAPPPSLCTVEETELANCASMDKKTKVTQLASVCASKDLDAEKGTMQFRMGTAGQPAELSYPETPSHPSKHFKLSLMNAPRQGYSYALQFTAQGVVYSFDHGGNDEEGRLSTSLEIEKNGKSSSLKCGDGRFEFDMSSPGTYGIPESEG